MNNKSVNKNIFFSIILTSSNFIFPLITYTYVARVILPSGTGKVAFVTAVLSYFGYIAALGIPNYGIRETAIRRNNKNELSKFAQEILLINLISTVISYILLFSSIIFISKFHSYTNLFVIMGSSLFLQMIGVEWLYKGLEMYSYITYRSLFFKCISVCLTFLLIKDSSDYVMYGFLTIFTNSASNILNFVNLRKVITFKKYDNYNLKRHLSPIFIFFMSTIIVSIYGQFDSLMLGFMKGDNTVGIYNAALKIKSVVLSVSTAITSVFIPRMSFYYNKGSKLDFYNLIEKSVRISLFLLFPLSIFLMMNSKDAVLFVCGSEYLSAKSTLIVLMMCCLALAITNIFGNQILIPKLDEKRYSESVFISLFINLSLNLVLIPPLSSLGAAIATLITEIFNIFWMGRGCKLEISQIRKRVNFKIYLFPIIIVTSITFPLFIYVEQYSLILRLFIKGIVFFGFYYILLYRNNEQITRRIMSNLIDRIGGEK